LGEKKLKTNFESLVNMILTLDLVVWHASISQNTKFYSNQKKFVAGQWDKETGFVTLNESRK